MPVIAVAALSARMMAEAAADDGFTVIALDLFGDRDTRRAAAAWLPIGEPASLQIDPSRVLGALRELAVRGDVLGWVPGGGFEGLPELLAQGAALLPLLGTAPTAVRRVRDPSAFFGFLASQGIAHPETQAGPPLDSAGWLLKDAMGSGGWHIRHAPLHSGDTVSPQHYFQREVQGLPMSATYLANGHDAIVLGFNELLVRRIGARPYVYGGALGPVPLPPALAAAVTAAVRALAAEFSLCGLGSLDFIRQRNPRREIDRFSVLEVNPRPPATLWAHAHGLARGAMGAHVQACLQRILPVPLPLARPEDVTSADALSGLDIVYARRPLDLDEAALQRLAAWPGAHDLPWSATRFEAGDPVCSLGASGAHAAQVKARLQSARETLLNELEMAG